MPQNWVLGALAAAVGSLGAGVGENLVRLSYCRLQDVPEDKHPPPWKRPLWVVGWVLTTVLTSCCAVAGLALAPMQLVMPIGGLHILFGVAVAHIINREPMGLPDAAGALLVFVGVVVVVLSTDKSSQSPITFDTLLSLLTRTSSIAYISSAIIFATALVVFRTSTNLAAQQGEVNTGIIFSLMKPIAAPVLSGLCSANANLMIKFALSFVADASWDAVWRWPFWIATLMSIALGIGQVVTLNNALAVTPAVIVVPTANSVLIIVGSIAGILFSNDDTSWKSTFMLLLGIAFVIAGIVMLALREAAAEDLHLADKIEVDEEGAPKNMSFISASCETMSIGGYLDNISFNRLETSNALAGHTTRLKTGVGRMVRKLSHIRGRGGAVRQAPAQHLSPGLTYSPEDIDMSECGTEHSIALTNPELFPPATIIDSGMRSRRCLEQQQFQQQQLQQQQQQHLQQQQYPSASPLNLS